MQLTVHDGDGTLISLPKEPQHHLTNRLQAMCLFFLMIRMWRHHTAACIATMQLVTRSNSGKLRGILGVLRCTLEVPPYFQLQLPPNFYVLQCCFIVNTERHNLFILYPENDQRFMAL